MKKNSPRLFLLLIVVLGISIFLISCRAPSSVSSSVDSSPVEAPAIIAEAEPSVVSDLFPYEGAVITAETDDAANVLAWLSRHPDCAVSYSVAFPHGPTVSNTAVSLDLTEITSEDLTSVLELIPLLPNLQILDLGSDERAGVLSWEEILSLRESVPDAVLDYSFSLYGVPLTLMDDSIDISKIHVDDDGALVTKIMRCMPNLSHLCMDRCGVGLASGFWQSLHCPYKCNKDPCFQRRLSS